MYEEISRFPLPMWAVLLLFSVDRIQFQDMYQPLQLPLRPLCRGCCKEHHPQRAGHAESSGSERERESSLLKTEAGLPPLLIDDVYCTSRNRSEPLACDADSSERRGMTSVTMTSVTVTLARIAFDASLLLRR